MKPTPFSPAMANTAYKIDGETAVDALKHNKKSEEKPRLDNYSSFETSRSLSHHMRKFVSQAQHPLCSLNLQALT